MKLWLPDIAFAYRIKKRARWACERCGRQYAEGHAQGLDCSHIFGRSNFGTRWHPQNAVAHCRGCHQYLGANPLEFAEFANERFGEITIEDIRRIKNATVKITKKDRAAIGKEYRNMTQEDGEEFDMAPTLLAILRRGGL